VATSGSALGLDHARINAARKRKPDDAAAVGYAHILDVQGFKFLHSLRSQTATRSGWWSPRCVDHFF